MTTNSTDEDLTLGDSLAVQWVGLRTFTAKGVGSVPGWGTKIPQATCVCVCAESLQLCPTLCDPVDLILPGSSVHGILQARILEWVAIFFTQATENGKKKKKLDPGQQGWALAVSSGAVTWILRLTQGWVTGA